MRKVCLQKTANIDSVEMKYMNFKTDIKAAGAITKEGIKYGIVKGYASTYGNVDVGGDIVAPGAFTASIERHKENERPIRMMYQHQRDKLIGGFPIDKVVDDEKGLFVEGEINLEVQEGRAAYALALQGVLTDFSIGYSIKDAELNKEGLLILKEVELWEISPVAEPMNTEARITDVKGATSYKNLPLAPRDRRWSASEAATRVRRLTNSEDSPSPNYRNAFLWYDSAEPDKFGSYKLPFADVIGGELKAVPRALFNAAARLNQTNIPAADKKRVATHINKYYDKMGLESPLKNNGEFKENCEWIGELFDDESMASEINGFECMKDIENFLKDPVPLSSNARKILISKIKSFSRDVEDDDKGVRDVREEVVDKIDEINKILKGFKNA